jgi:N-acylneuraminate cytidylyltransferase
MTLMRTLCIIPARGGSKRIPRKNIRPFLGEPIIVHPIRAALRSACFSEVMVSTDDAEIASVATSAGANVPFLRSAENASDHAGTVAVLEEVLNSYAKSRREFDIVCCIYPTAVFASPELLLRGRDLLIEEEATDSVIPVVRYAYPIQRSMRMEAGRLAMRWPEHLHTRSQDLDAAFHDAGQFYWFRVASLQRHGRLMTDTTRGLELSEAEVQDVDNEVDWELAEIKWRRLRA